MSQADAHGVFASWRAYYTGHVESRNGAHPKAQVPSALRNQRWRGLRGLLGGLLEVTDLEALAPVPISGASVPRMTTASRSSLKGQSSSSVPRRMEVTMPESMTRQLELAESLARRVHADQVDKSGAPYIEHPRRVVAKLTDPRAQVVAWLHDVLEDTETSEGALRAQFDGTIVDAVVALTKSDEETPEEYHARVRANE